MLGNIERPVNVFTASAPNHRIVVKLTAIYRNIQYPDINVLTPDPYRVSKNWGIV